MHSGQLEAYRSYRSGCAGWPSDKEAIMAASSGPSSRRSLTPKRTVQWVALTLAVAGLLAVALLPAYAQTTQTSSSS